MMQETGIQLNELELESPDLPFGLGSGAAVIYGTTGGVAEAVVRHCLPDKSKNALREISILGLRGDGLHQSDNAAMFKRAERNPIVVRMMAEYGEERCHELLHVSYRGE